MLDALWQIFQSLRLTSVVPAHKGPEPPAGKVAPAAIAPTPPLPEVKERDLIPGNFLSFPCLLEVEAGGAVHTGLPGIAIRNPITGAVRWAMRSPMPGEPTLHRLVWEDDPVRGVRQRTLENVEDVLGAEGQLQGQLYRFEQILSLGNRIVVYALFNPLSGTRLAYGFSRNAFQPGYVFPREPLDEGTEARDAANPLGHEARD